MDQIKNVGITTRTVDVDPEMEELVQAMPELQVDPALSDAETTVQIVVDNATTGKPMVIVLGNPNVSDVTRRLLAELEKYEPIDDVVRDIWPEQHKPPRRVGLVGGAVHMAIEFLSAAHGPNGMMWHYPQEECYFDYRQRIRDEEVARQIRRPPKKAICSSRRRGRKFKG